ncbi:MAG: hypothetical protein JWP89_2622 [Schlesneria sp.]|nr:hypothetical protein [Schlesneria sp.]
MIATFVFVPPGGGEADYSLDFEVPGVPQRGDYVQVWIDGQDGTRDFIVRRTWWQLGHPDVGPYVSSGNGPQVHGRTKGLMIECEYSEGPYSNDGHKRAITANQNPEQELTKFEATAF